jgi:PAS domain S-box-containing protein
MPEPQRDSWKGSEAELFRLLVENVKDYAIFVVDPVNQVRSWNPAAERLLGYGADEIIGQSADVFFTPEDRQAGVPQHEMRQALEGGRGNDDRWHVRKDGSRFWSGGMMTPLWDEARNLRGFAKIMRDRTEWKTREERERLHAKLLDTVGQAVIATTPDGTIFYWNKFAEDMYGWPGHEAVGRSVMEVTVPQSQATSARSIMRRLAAGESWTGEFPVKRRDGTTLTAQVTNAPLLDDEGNLKAVIGVSSDVSGRKRSEGLLRDSEERFRSLMEQAPFSIQVFSPDGRTIRVNRAWEELWGVRFEQIEGYNILDDRQLEAKGVLHFVRQGFGGRAARIPAIEYNPNETIPDITQQDDPRRWLSAVIYPLKDGDGNVREVVLIHEDISGQKKAEEGLRQSRAQLSAELSTMSQLHELSTRLLACHDLPAALHEVLDAAIDLLGAAFGNIQLHEPKTGTLLIAAQRGFEKDFLSHFQAVRTDDEAACGRAMRSGKRVIIEDVQTDAAYEPHREAAAAAGFQAVQSTPLRSRKGELLGMLSTHFRRPHRPPERDLRVLDLYARQAADFIERLQIEEALREADRRKDEFLATLAHELRNPLAPIRNSLEVLKMPRVDAAMAQRSREMIERQVHQLVRLVDDLLDVSRVTRGKIDLRREQVELATVVARAVETAQPLIEMQGHELEISVPPESLLVEADPVRLAQVVGNLLTNAAKYTEPSGRIRLTARRDGGLAALSVLDNGIGIAPDMLPHVFDLFVQADYASTKAQGGLGIGLTLVRNLVELHGGVVEARSRGLGEGSEFIVKLPLTSRSGPDRGERACVGEDAPALGLRLLVVDDNGDAAASLSTLLQLQGHEVRIADNGPIALEIAAAFRPDMLFLDLGMPGMDGYEVARRVRKTPGLETTPITALTGWGQIEDRRRTAEAGFNHHLVKPPDLLTLTNLLAELKRTSDR